MSQVSVIIPFKNSAATMQACLDSFLKQHHTDFELILVDNNSQDASRRMAEEFAEQHEGQMTVRLVTEATPGPAAARNRGLQLGDGEYLAFTDSDCVADPAWLRDLVAALDDEGIGGVAGNIRGYAPTGLIDAFHGLFTLRGLPEERTFRHFALDSGGFSTTNLAVRRRVLDAVGPFDESLRTGEDHDICARIYGQGHAIRYVANAVIHHIHRRSIAATWKQAFGFGRVHARLLRKHFERYVLIQIGGATVRTTRIPARAWIDLNAADKKLLGLLVAAAVYWPLAALLPAYLGYLALSIWRRARREQVPVGLPGSAAVAVLLVVKSAAMTLGRLWGGARYRVACF